MEMLILKDGTELEGHVLPNGDGRTIFVYLDGMSIMEGFEIFSEKTRISIIRELSHGEEHIYEGFTEITAISSEYGNCNITMKKVM